MAGHDDPISEPERAQLRLRRLNDISKLLTHFPSFERTISEVVARIAATVSLRSVIFILETRGAPQTITWQAEGASARSRQFAKAHAQEAYSDLVRSGVELEHEEVRTLETLQLVPPASAADRNGNNRFVLLPFVVNHGVIFGALQIQGARELDELDLFFINAVVNQLAIALDRYTADRALRASEGKLAGIIAIASDAVISVNETQRIVMYNGGAEKIFGWSREEALGKALDMLIPERFRQTHQQHVWAFADGPDTTRKVSEGRSGILGLRKNGEEFPTDAAISKLNVEGAWLFTVILRDITDHKRIEHRETFLAEVGAILATTLDSQQTCTNIAQLVIRGLGDFCLIELIDEHRVLQGLTVTTADPEKAHLAEALKWLPLDRSRPHLSSVIVESRQSQLIAECTPQTLDALTQSAEHRRLLNAIAPTSMMGVPLLVHGRLVGSLVVASCRPERRYTVTDVRLLEEVGRRAALALENARLYLAAQRALQARDDVLGIVAHDLRAPLGTILLEAAILRRSGAQSQSIESAASRMNRLIRDLLDVTVIEAGSLSIECARVDPARLVLDSVAAHSRLAVARSVVLRSDLARDLAEIWADRDRLLQVFENLIGNAIKFTHSDGLITVGARPLDREVLFWVADTGCGIEAADLTHLFERFWQARKSERRGAGLGLSIVRSLIEAHGGRLWAESAPGRGSTFSFTLPVAPRVLAPPSNPT